MEKIKAGIFIDKEARDNMNRLKEFGVRPNDFLDAILRFDEEGLIEYIKLIKQFKNSEEFTVHQNDVYCTTELSNLRKVELEKHISLESLQKMAIESNLKSNLTDNDIKSNMSTIFRYLVDVTKAILVIGKDGNDNKDEIKKLKLRIEKLEGSNRIN